MGGGSQRLSTASGASAPIQARVLGTFDLRIDGRPVDRRDWRRESAARLVKLLLTSPEHCLSRELAGETLWPGADPESSRTNLRKALHFARRALDRPGAITSDGDLIRLGDSLVEIDLDRLLRAFDIVAQRGSLRRPNHTSGVASQPDHGGREEAADALATALELGSQPLLPDDPYEEWLVDLREHLRARWQAIAIGAAREAIASERRADAHAILTQILDRDPMDEEAHCLLIDLYATEGRYHAVRRQFEQCRRALADGLDATPSAETEAAYRLAELAAQGQRVSPAQARLVGRRRELDIIEPLLDRVAAGRFGAIVIRGPAGIGKTRLLEAVRDRARIAGWRELAWQALESTRLIAFAPFAVRLADEVTASELDAWEEPARSGLATIVPTLSAVPHIAFADRSALQVALMSALAKLARRPPRLIAIDDVAALDEASIELLGLVSTGLSATPILVAVAYRDEEPLPEPARGLLDILRRVGSLEIRLGPLARQDIAPLVVGHLGGEALAAALAAALYERSEGNPLFCLELAREASDRGATRLDHGCWSTVTGRTLDEAPDTVRHLVAARTQSLPAGAAELLRVAAELGQPEFGYDTLSVVLPELSGVVIAALDAALASGLLVERGAGYAFGHPLYRLAVESSTGTARRADTHFAIACSLAGLAPPAASEPAEIRAAAARSPHPALVTQHGLRAFELGRPEGAALAVGFGFVAASRARTLLDRPAAATLFGHALDTWKRLPPSVARQFDASAAYASLAELRIADGDDAAAEVGFRSALDAARDADELARAYERFTGIAQRHGDFEAIIALCEEARARLPADAAGPRAILQQRIGYSLVRLARFDAAIAALKDAVPVLESTGELAYLASALDMLGCAFGFDGRTDEGIGELRRALAIALELHDALQDATVRAHLGALLTWTGRAAEARPLFARALELADQIGEWYHESVCAWLAADTEDAVGNLDAARLLRERELALLSRVGGNPHNEALAHAHLAHIARQVGDHDAEQRNAQAARARAASDQDPGYAARIEEAMTVANWSAVHIA